MNSDSKLKRYIVLLDKAPFVLFLESANYLPHADHLIPALKLFNLSFADVLTSAPIQSNQDLRKIISATNTLDDPLAYNIIEALSDALLNTTKYLRHFPIHFFTKSDWQNYIDWQNVGTKPEPITETDTRDCTKELVEFHNFWNTGKDSKPVPQNEFTIVVAKFTHEIRIFSGKEPNTTGHDGGINLHSPDSSAPFPLSLLKECVININDIIVQASIGRTLTAMTESKYLSVMQTGHDTFNYINMKKVEKDLRAVLAAFNIAVEE